MTREIGSDFEINFGLFFGKKRNNILRNSILLSSGRDCISYLIKSLELGEKSYVLLPSYLCESVLVPFGKFGVKYGFYKVDGNLRIVLNDLKRKLEKNKPDLLFVIHYFGVEQPKIGEIKRLCEKNEVKLVEDQVQSFLSSYPVAGDYMFNSYRKFLPVPDGAFLLGNFDRKIGLEKPNKSYVKTRLYAGLLKNFGFMKPFWKKRFVNSEEYLIDLGGLNKMSRISKYLLNRIDFRAIVERRRKNYLYLVNKLRDVGFLYPEISKSVCPLGCPILVDDRDEVRKILIKNKIYCPVHWKLPSDVDREEFRDSWRVSDSILTIPIDQRYGLKDMKRIVDVLSKF